MLIIYTARHWNIVDSPAPITFCQAIILIIRDHGADFQVGGLMRTR